MHSWLSKVCCHPARVQQWSAHSRQRPLGCGRGSQGVCFDLLSAAGWIGAQAASSGTAGSQVNNTHIHTHTLSLLTPRWRKHPHHGSINHESRWALNFNAPLPAATADEAGSDGPSWRSHHTSVQCVTPWGSKAPGYISVCIRFEGFGSCNLVCGL